jgi:hypothetical protein
MVICMRRLAYLLFILSFAALSSFAQGILPTSLPGWNSEAPSATTAASIPQTAKLPALVLQEYGYTGTQTMTYMRSGRAAETLHATIYSFQDASGAFGAYSFLRTPEMAKANYSDNSATTNDQVLVLTGNLLLDIDGRGVERDEAAIKLLASDGASHAQRGVYPALPSQLPSKDLVPRTERYFVGPVALAQFWSTKGAAGDWLGFSKGAEAVVAKYRLRNREFTLLLADYPTPQIGATQMEKFSQEFNIGIPGRATLSGSAEKKAPELYARRDGSLIALVSGAPSEADANEVLDQIQSGVIVTWNAPASKLNEPTMADIIVGTIIGTGEMCLIAIVIGAIFSLVRLGVKWAWPGKVFDRPEHLEILQLGLTSKSYKAKDLY